MAQRRRRKKPRIWPFGLAGVAAGLVFVWWTHRPPGPLVLGFVHGQKPIQQGTLPGDDRSAHFVRTWSLNETFDSVVDHAADELRQSDGWQPPTRLPGSPSRIQFVRVKDPRGKDFQFVRVLITEKDPKATLITLDEGPRMNHAFGS